MGGWGLASSLRGFADKGKFSESNCDVKEQNQFDEFEVLTNQMSLKNETVLVSIKLC